MGLFLFRGVPWREEGRFASVDFPPRLKLKKIEIYETTKENGVRSFEIFGLWAVVCSSSVGIVDVVGKTHMGAWER